MIPLLFKEGSGVVGPAVTLNPTPPPPPPAEEGSHFQSRGAWLAAIVGGRLAVPCSFCTPQLPAKMVYPHLEES